MWKSGKNKTRNYTKTKKTAERYDLPRKKETPLGAGLLRRQKTASAFDDDLGRLRFSFWDELTLCPSART
jgi:hypothetical protein